MFPVLISMGVIIKSQALPNSTSHARPTSSFGSPDGAPACVDPEAEGSRLPLSLLSRPPLLALHRLADWGTGTPTLWFAGKALLAAHTLSSFSSELGFHCATWCDLVSLTHAHRVCTCPLSKLYAVPNQLPSTPATGYVTMKLLKPRNR
jgi:hypothetical protein